MIVSAILVDHAMGNVFSKFASFCVVIVIGTIQFSAVIGFTFLSAEYKYGCLIKYV